MKRWMLALAVPLALAACRTIVGIDDLQFQPGPNNNNRDEGGPPDGGNEGGADSGVLSGPITVTPTGATKIATCKASSDCRQCCKQGFAELRNFESPGPGRDCLCEPRHCKDRCSDAGEPCSASPSVGGGPSSGGPNECIRCIDDTLGASQNTCQSACGAKPECLDGLACLQTCDGNR